MLIYRNSIGYKSYLPLQLAHYAVIAILASGVYVEPYLSG